MKRFISGIAVLAAATSFYASPLFAADAPTTGPSNAPNVSTEKGKPGDAEAVNSLAEASKLVSFARDNENPTVMLAAVQIIEKISVQENGDRISGEPKTAADPKAQKSANASQTPSSPAPTLDCKKLLTEAKDWAKGDTNMLALIDSEMTKVSAAKTGTLGASGGVQVARGVLLPGYQIDYSIRFDGGYAGVVGVVGGGDSDLDLYIYDMYGNLICKDDDYTDTCRCDFVPYYTSVFTVRIINHGNSADAFLLETN